jgi:hypothetical protein
MPGEAFLDSEYARRHAHSDTAWGDAQAVVAETERLAEAAETEATVRRQLAGLEQAGRRLARTGLEQGTQAAESDAEGSTHATAPDFIRLGLTYRQVDHWTARGWLHPDAQHPGSGYQRRWPRTELEVARLMRRMTNVGIEPWAAHSAARAMVNDGGRPLAQRASLGGDVWIEVR